MTYDFKQDVFKEIIKYSKLKVQNFRYNIQFWTFICKNFTLPEEFIREYKNIIDWNIVSRYQNLSMDFLREFKNKIDWEWYKYKLNKKQAKELGFKIE